MTCLVTGSMGCLGGWVLKHLVVQGERPVSFDLSTNRSHLDLLMTPEEQNQIAFVTGDLGDYAQVEHAMLEHNVTHIIHLGALQIPFCRADPVAGARVNVLGTTHVFEAARKAGVHHLAPMESSMWRKKRKSRTITSTSARSWLLPKMSEYRSRF